MRVRVNNSKPLKFIFDTGASHTGIDSKRAAELGIKSEGEARGTATGGAVQGTYATGVSLAVSGAEVPGHTVFLFPFPTVPGFEFDGVIGYDFINAFVVEIDYLKKIMNLYDPRTYSYRGKGAVIPLLLADRRTPLAHVTIVPRKGPPVKTILEVDTGGDRAFIINNTFVKKHGLVSAIANTTESGGRGAGGEYKALTGRAKTARLGRFVFNNPPVTLVLEEGEGASEEGDGIVGGEIFRRFKVIFDYSRKRMILEPNKSFNDAFELETGEE
jgi:hypothetical protein